MRYTRAFTRYSIDVHLGIGLSSQDKQALSELRGEEPLQYDESGQDIFMDGGAQDNEPEDNDSEWQDDPQVDAIRIALRDLASAQCVMSSIFQAILSHAL